MNAVEPVKGAESGRMRASSQRIVLASVIVILIAAYTLGTVSGIITSDRKIDAVHLILIGLAVLSVALCLRPDLLDRLKLFELSGFKVEMLEKVREKQAAQESQLEDIVLVLPLLLAKYEQMHLLNLDARDTGGYRGNHSLRTELRRLRSMGLIKMRSNHEVGQLKDDLPPFDLSEYVELTTLGSRWVRRIKEIEHAERPDDTM